MVIFFYLFCFNNWDFDSEMCHYSSEYNDSNYLISSYGIPLVYSSDEPVSSPIELSYNNTQYKLSNWVYFE
jgi:hypothetical protein